MGPELIAWLIAGPVIAFAVKAGLALNPKVDSKALKPVWLQPRQSSPSPEPLDPQRFNRPPTDPLSWWQINYPTHINQETGAWQ